MTITEEYAVIQRDSKNPMQKLKTPYESWEKAWAAANKQVNSLTEESTTIVHVVSTVCVTQNVQVN